MTAIYMTDFLGTPIWMWAIFFALVLLLLAFDLGVLNKKDHEIGVSESLKLSAFYVVVAILFGGWVWYERGAQAGAEYFTGYVIEKVLAMDNIFVIAMIFSFLAIPRVYQHRVLFWGILGVIVLRGIMIALGAALVNNFSWVLYIFAAFLILTGVKMLVFADNEAPDLNQNPLLKFLRRHFNIEDRLHGNSFFIKKADEKTGKMVNYMTPLFVALILVEVADVVFAVDSIPAIFAITTDTFIIYTSNVFAILGLRALYFALSAMVERFKFLKYAISLLLIFIGSKIFLADLFGLEKFPPALSLGVTFGILGTGVFYSLWMTRSGQGESDKK